METLALSLAVFPVCRIQWAAEFRATGGSCNLFGGVMRVGDVQLVDGQGKGVITIDDISRLESVMRDMPQAEIPTEHNFCPGFYARTINIPAGCTLTGKVHATEHIFMLTKGTLMMATEDGAMTVSAPYQAICRPGIKRVGHALTDVVCTNIHITTETDLVRLESDLIAPEESDGIASNTNQSIGLEA